MRHFLLLVLFTFVLSISAKAQTMTKSFMHDGVNRTYTIYIPANYNASNPVPLILNFHGFGGSNTQQMTLANFRPIADTAGFIVVCPLGTLLPVFNLPHWNVGSWTVGSPANDVDFTSVLIDSIAANYSINPSRIYATGFSNGGFFSHKLAQQLSDRIAAIASVAGTFSPEMMTDNPNPTHPTPVLQIHGTTDGTVAYNGSTSPAQMIAVDSVLDYWVNYNNCDLTPSVTAVPDINTADGSTVEHIIYNNGNNGVTVEHFKITGGGHTWPGTLGANRDINACEEIWKFFNKSALNPTSVIDYKNNLNISLYPNPSNGILHVSMDGLKSERYTVMNIQGAVITSGTITANDPKIDISSLADNVYIVDIANQSFKVSLIR